jgi:transposase
MIVWILYYVARDLCFGITLANKKKSYMFIANLLGLAKKTIARYVKIYKETEDIKPKIPTLTRPRRVDYEKARKYIEVNPDKTLKEMGKVLGTKDMGYVMYK